uniref:Retrotransposon protein, putative, Ty1-copia subclass n=1 Tax=Tanacetum cinerariifolium TaxID=118510 RepID=A0A6L2JNM0_TANCI|nr:hypothetical protein [Tanacetum cinerariifolium]
MEWYRNLRIVLSTQDKLPCLEQPIPTLPVPPERQANPSDVVTTHQAWVKAQKKIVGLMLMTMDPNIQKNLEHLGAYDMLKKLKTLYVQQAYQELLQTVLILVSLRKEYDGFVQNYNMHSMEKTVTELHAMLTLHEQTLPPREVAPALHAIRVGRIQKNQKKSHKAAKGNQGKGKAKMDNALMPAPWFKIARVITQIASIIALHLKFRIRVPNARPSHIAFALYLLNASHLNCARIRITQWNLGPLAHWIVKRIFKPRPAPSYALKPKNPPTPKKDNPAKDAICHQCGEVGHWRRNYPVYLIELMKKRSYLKELALQGLRGSRKLKSGALSLYVGDGHRARVEDHGIIAHRTPPYTSQHNGVSERRNRTLLDMGYEALVKRDTLTKPNKLEPRAFRCIFVRYPKETMGYSFYYLPENKVFVAWNVGFFENDVIDHEASRSLEDLEIIQEEDTHPSLDTSLDHEEDDQEIDEPQSDINPIRRSTRIRRAPDQMCLYVDFEEHELGDLVKPANYKAALLDPESDKWLNAMNWLFKKNTDMDGAVHTYKAHLVAKGFIQTLGIDYKETFSLDADIRDIKILIAITAFYDYEIWQMDVKIAFLYGYLNEEVYMKQPEASGSYVTFLILYVDDILIMGNNIPMLQDVKSYLGRCFAMKDLGEAAYILGIKIYRDRSKRLVSLCQSANIEKILKKYYMENSKRETISMQEKMKFSKSQGASTHVEIQRMQNIPYALAVGSIMYALRCTRPDVVFAPNITSRFPHNPSDAHWTAVKNILKYLRNTKDMFLVYKGDTQ